MGGMGGRGATITYMMIVYYLIGAGDFNGSMVMIKVNK